MNTLSQYFNLQSFDMGISLQVMEIQRMDLRRHMEATNPKIPTLVIIPKIYDPMKMSTLRNDILFDLSMTNL